jgi:DNA-binding transcriptional regulator LsrR (DeoR family)
VQAGGANPNVADQNDALITSVARMYYLDGLGQSEIANICGVSRSTVSRLLTTARERGIVRISVDEFDPRDRDLERQLIDHFGLRHAIVVREMGGSPASIRRAVGYFAAPIVAEWIGSQRLVGLAGGRTLGELVHNIEPRTRDTGPAFVQLMGTIGSSPGRIDASELSRTLARRFQGSFLTLNAPAFAQSQRARDLFLSHDEIRTIWNAFDSLDLALVGVGTLEESAIVERGVLKAEAFDEVRAAGAVGEICGRFFDDRGRECASDLRDCVVSIGLDALRECNDVAAVVSGPSRTRALRGAICGGIVTSIVIDQSGAQSLVNTI